jgi:hypothetical protein
MAKRFLRNAKVVHFVKWAHLKLLAQNSVTKAIIANLVLTDQRKHQKEVLLKM